MVLMVLAWGWLHPTSLEAGRFPWFPGSESAPVKGTPEGIPRHHLGITGVMTKTHESPTGFGMRINQVLPNSLADQMGLVAGDMLISVNQGFFSNQEGYYYLLQRLGGYVELGVRQAQTGEFIYRCGRVQLGKPVVCQTVSPAMIPEQVVTQSPPEGVELTE